MHIRQPWNKTWSTQQSAFRKSLTGTPSKPHSVPSFFRIRMTAQYGHYLEPFAKLILAVAALRDNNRAHARELLTELHNRFPDNQLYARELSRLQ